MLRPPVSRIPRIVRAPLVAGTGIEPVFSAYETEEISLPPTRNVFLKLKNLQQKSRQRTFTLAAFGPESLSLKSKRNPFSNF